MDSCTYFGELTIMSFLLQQANTERVQADYYWCQGDKHHNYDSLIHKVNSRLRPACDAFAITAKNSEVAKDTIKAIAKELEESSTLQ